MAPSKSTRIMILLGIDTAFFLLELIVGQWCADSQFFQANRYQGTSVHSLALVADSFHMVRKLLVFRV